MCDLRVASTRARFGSTFVKVGLIPGDGGAYFLSKAVGLSRALELMMTGRLLSAQDAEQWGLLNRVVDPDALLESAFDLAQLIAQNAPLAVQLTKSAAYQSQHLSVDAALNLAASYQGIVQNTQDHLEGVHALLEKRAPQFKGQ
jgi:enoyl-CoA hydratase/carnithine racemase